MAMMTTNVFQLKDLKTVPDPIQFYTKNIQDNQIPLVVDNGSHQCCVGWATDSKPTLVFKNLIAKTRRERGKKDGELQVGNDITNIEAVRFQLKTQFDRNIVTNFDVQEHLFDYSFYHLGIDTEGRVNHPIVITEAFLNPNQSRQMMSEMLFECYGVPAVCYGVDALFSFLSENKSGKKNFSSGLILNLGHQTMHIIPVIDGRIDSKHARRINIGGFHVCSYMHRLLQLKYPAHFNAITLSRAEELVYDHSSIAVDYAEELNKWSDPDYYDDNVKRIQLPYATPSANLALTADQQKERRKELAKRLVEINARKRDERLAEDEEQLNQFLELQELLNTGQEKRFQKTLATHDLSSEADLLKQISVLRSRIQRTKQKIAAVNASEDAVVEEPKAKVPKKGTLRPAEGEEIDAWIVRIKKDRQEIIEKRAARHQRKQDLAKRRTAAAQERMRIISELARKDKGDDKFGMRDEDWDVYKVIRRDGGDSDSEEEQERLVEMDEVLRQRDPTFADSNSAFSSVGDSSPLHPAEAHQLHVGIELLRAPEILFQPSMIGIHEAGLAETVEFVLKQYSPETQAKLVSNVFLTGGCSTLPGIVDRLRRELREIRPFESSFNVRVASDPGMSAWKAARDFASQPAAEFQKYLITRQDYTEKGGEYLKEHAASNPFNPSPAPLGQTQPAVSEDIEMELFQDA